MNHFCPCLFQTADESLSFEPSTHSAQPATISYGIIISASLETR
ncbi:hypothetical protein [Fervidibacter sp.]